MTPAQVWEKMILPGHDAMPPWAALDRLGEDGTPRYQAYEALCLAAVRRLMGAYSLDNLWVSTAYAHLLAALPVAALSCVREVRIVNEAMSGTHYFDDNARNHLYWCDEAELS